MVLSACSPYFNALFVNHPEKHPIVILKDVPYSDMKSLLDFMYRGEVSVDQERLTAFLRVAESLRIKGLTEVNDDRPTSAENAPAPPQLQRIQPYVVPQQQQQQQHQQRKQQTNVLAAAALQAAAAAAQPSLLSAALMPKRKRGRPRKLSGSSNGTGNDYDEYDRDGMLNVSMREEEEEVKLRFTNLHFSYQDSDMGNGKLGNESYSGNDDGSDDNQQGSNNDDLNVSYTLSLSAIFITSSLITFIAFLRPYRKVATRCPQRDRKAGKINAWHNNNKTTTALPVSFGFRF